jgi:hypothetical protein
LLPLFFFFKVQTRCQVFHKFDEDSRLPWWDEVLNPGTGDEEALNYLFASQDVLIAISLP